MKGILKQPKFWIGLGALVAAIITEVGWGEALASQIELVIAAIGGAGGMLAGSVVIGKKQETKT